MLSCTVFTNSLVGISHTLNWELSTVHIFYSVIPLDFAGGFFHDCFIPYKMPASPLMAVAVALMALLACLTHQASSTDEADTAGTSYGILLDAGSTSTKLNIYRWASSQHEHPGLHLIKRQKFSPGLGAVSLMGADVSDYIQDILDSARDEIPETLRAQTPVLLLATAGLRYLTKKDVMELLGEVKAALADGSRNPFSFSEDNVQVLSGEEEGVYAWVALNYLLGHLNGTGSGKNTHGVLEMGGGSTQIAFLPKVPLFQEEYQVEAMDKVFHIYVQSYLKYGSTALETQVAHKLNLDNETISNPCMLKGDTKKVPLEDGSQVLLTGSGRPSRCKDILRRLLKPAQGINCQPKPCAIGRVYQPPVGDMTFTATQAFTYAPQSLGAVGADNVLNITKLYSSAKAYCKKDLAVVLSENPDRGAKYASMDCLMGLYIPTLLTLSYGFKPETEQIRVTSKVGDQRVDWALGAMLVELSKRKAHNQIYSVKCKESNKATLGQSRASENDGRRLQGRQETVVFCGAVIAYVWKLMHR